MYLPTHTSQGLMLRMCGAEEVRVRLLRQTNNPQLVQRLAPMQAGEAEAARRARSLWASFAQNMDGRSQPLLQV